ncbi:hypothetical protein QYE76_032036 [Lolium multiflorum]|uniref:Uncharacterized protein n=1 Tax=Lolium multiflorum TaxID=4521 RepID=A0AAD8QSU0_LOLMU|nr:hypothetical protein QYE76_032036 [Lolium multiflorum]
MVWALVAPDLPFRLLKAFVANTPILLSSLLNWRLKTPSFGRLSSLRLIRLLEANRLATNSKKENALLKEEVSKLKQQMKDEQDARRAAAVAIDKKEGVLRESIKDLLEAANITVTRRHQLREDSTSDALSLAAESNGQVLGLL